MGPLTPWEQGDFITHRRLNDMQRRAELAGKVRGAGDTTVGVSMTGVRIASPRASKTIPFLLQNGLTYPAFSLQPPYTEDAQAVYLDTPNTDYLGQTSRTATLYYLLALRDSGDNYVGLPAWRSGMIVYAIWSKQSGRWEVVAPEPQTTWPFELTENLIFGSNATAKVLILSGGTYSVDDDVTFEVYDPFSKFNQNDKPTGQGGARGYAKWLPDSAQFEIVELEHQARWIKFILNAALATTDASVACDNVTYVDGYQPDTAVTTVYNEPASSDYIYEGDNNDKGQAVYDPGNDKYWIRMVECP